MSLTSKRVAFQSALESVDGVRGFARRPASPRAGDAWVLLASGERDQPSGQFMMGWSVVLYLPQEFGAADAWLDDHLDAIVDAIEGNGVAYVDGFAPANLGDDNNPINGLMLTTRSE